MDKQKQIEEMIRDLIPFLVKKEFVEEILKQPFSYFDGMYEDEKAICKELIRLNYQKIPENAVVLTREAYDELTLIKQSIFDMLEERDDKARKETAEKFAERLKEYVFGDFSEYDYGYLCIKIDGICKEIKEGKK